MRIKTYSVLLLSFLSPPLQSVRKGMIISPLQCTFRVIVCIMLVWLCVLYWSTSIYLNVLISFSQLQWQRPKSVSIFQLKWTLFMLTHLMKPLYCIQGSIRGEHREREKGRKGRYRESTCKWDMDMSHVYNIIIIWFMLYRMCCGQALHWLHVMYMYYFKGK